MIIYKCDWCLQEFSLNYISTVAISNVYSDKLTLHICHICGRGFPETAQPILSWTAK